MAADLNPEREHVHSRVDKAPPAKLGAVRELLEVFVDDDRDTLSPSFSPTGLRRVFAWSLISVAAVIGGSSLFRR